MFFIAIACNGLPADDWEDVAWRVDALRTGGEAAAVAVLTKDELAAGVAEQSSGVGSGRHHTRGTASPPREAADTILMEPGYP